MTDRSKPAVLASALATLILALGVTVVRAADPPGHSFEKTRPGTRNDVESEAPVTGAVVQRKSLSNERKADVLKQDGGEKKRGE